MKVGISLSISAKRRCSTITKGMYKGSLLTRITNGSAIFHRTVLEGYWELEARTGTRMTATTRSFCSFRLFSCRKTRILGILRKRWKIRTKTQLSSLIFQWKCEIKSRKWKYRHYVYTRKFFNHPDPNACATAVQSEQLNPVHANKNHNREISR